MIGDKTVVNWPDSDIEKLRELVKLPLTASQIGQKMGRSRNAVIGRLRRLGLPLLGAVGKRGSRGPRVRKTAMVKETTDRPATKRRIPSRPSRWDYPSEAPIIPANKGRGITIFELNHSNCHTVIGSTRPAKGLPRYCGQPAWNGTAYCEDHFAVFHRPPFSR